ncbi:GNAT family N-acetyltransferase [Fluviicola sp.]|uniref:GNAT family N-acetyltransferase n=1 Tax=Fluviicola sp. TaxID=1917219 RepID=UPI0031D09403
MNLRKATLSEIPVIWKILQQAIERRKQDGSAQWQDGYPNEQTIENDLANGYGYVLVENDQILGYAAIIFDIEPAYTDIQGKWLTNGEYVVIHRVATSNEAIGKGIATRLFQLIEDLAINAHVFSIKVDTNFDNPAMLKILDKLDYTYCGEVFFRGSARKAFEKVLQIQNNTLKN